MDLILEYISFLLEYREGTPVIQSIFSVLLSKPCTMHRTTPPFFKFRI